MCSQYGVTKGVRSGDIPCYLEAEELHLGALSSSCGGWSVLLVPFSKQPS